MDRATLPTPQQIDALLGWGLWAPGTAHQAWKMLNFLKEGNGASGLETAEKRVALLKALQRDWLGKVVQIKGRAFSVNKGVVTDILVRSRQEIAEARARTPSPHPCRALVLSRKAKILYLNFSSLSVIGEDEEWQPSHSLPLQPPQRYPLRLKREAQIIGGEIKALERKLHLLRLTAATPFVKFCTICGKEMVREDFSPEGHLAWVRYAKCSECSKKSASKWRYCRWCGGVIFRKKGEGANEWAGRLVCQPCQIKLRKKHSPLYGT